MRYLCLIWRLGVDHDYTCSFYTVTKLQRIMELNAANAFTSFILNLWSIAINTSTVLLTQKTSCVLVVSCNFRKKHVTSMCIVGTYNRPPTHQWIWGWVSTRGLFWRGCWDSDSGSSTSTPRTWSSPTRWRAAVSLGNPLLL